LAAGLGAVSLLARRSPPASALDLLALSAATFKASRTLSHERVASFVREPFVEGEDERPMGEGVQRAIGELVTCSRCVGTWVAAGLASTQMVARSAPRPRTTSSRPPSPRCARRRTSWKKIFLASCLRC
jgi:Protein of unknown function (DUF1360)